MSSTISRISVIIVLLALAGGAYMFRERLLGRSGPPQTVDSATNWFCHHCGNGFTLPANEYAGRVRFTLTPEDLEERGRKTLIRPVARIDCPRCGKQAVAARQCLTDGAIFDPRRGPNSSGACPKCGWRPYGSRSTAKPVGPEDEATP
ncbi:MAG: hypothetical protein HUU22_14780 [Phycisphaerae bacterium]|nr:hypothetical protein [Phycisphaerae bacterium]NUQ47286.1 hypothetical protein [Phycisphaerae bacterium]